MYIYEKDLNKFLAGKKFGKLVFTNGVFDILHKGHVDYLNASKEFGDYLIVGINSDSSVKKLKGESRPINTETDRAFIVSNLKAVDLCVIFEELTPYSLIEKIIPQVLVKGGDYDENETNRHSAKYIVGSDLVRDRGGEVRTINLTKGKSTTKTIAKISLKS